MLSSKILIVSGAPIWVIFQNSVTYIYMMSFHTLYFLNTEIARINELRAMADMLQKQLEGSVHVPGSNGSGGGGSSSGGPMGSRGGGSYGSRNDRSMGGAGGRSDESGSVVLVSNLNEKVRLYLVYIYVFNV